MTDRDYAIKSMKEITFQMARAPCKERRRNQESIEDKEI